jgi:hypothetical protein
MKQRDGVASHRESAAAWPASWLCSTDNLDRVAVEPVRGCSAAVCVEWC